jgi:hypothetical protein
MTNSQNPPGNVIHSSRFGLTNNSKSAQEVAAEQEPEEESLGPSPEQLQVLLAHLEHVSAEINTACAEGFYVRMLCPEIDITEKEGMDEYGNLHHIQEIAGIRLKYQFEKMDPKREKRVDHRDELSKQRSPEYQPPGLLS